MQDYKFSFGYLALKMLGKTLYSNPFAALSELIANGLDAHANDVWVYLDIRQKEHSKIVVLDNGTGMTDDDIKQKYLQVGKINRPMSDNKMMGRKGIGKLAAFYLSNDYYIITKTATEENLYHIDFTEFEAGIKREGTDDTYMTKVSSCQFPIYDIYQSIDSGTAIYMTDVNFVGYGEKSFDVLEYELAEMFSLKNQDTHIFLKIIRNDEQNTPFKAVQKRVAFKNMAMIYYNIDEPYFEKVKELNETVIDNADTQNADLKIKRQVKRYEFKSIEVNINGKTLKVQPRGWIGVHQTINRKIAPLNDPENFLDNKFYHFNKIRIYVRGKLALENILPYVHNTQYYSNYIEGELECDELDDNRFPDIASSSRQDIDKNDPRFIALLNSIKEAVNSLVNFKDLQTKQDDALKKKKQKNALKSLTTSVSDSLEVGKKIREEDIEGIKHTLSNSFESVEELAKTDYVLFLSHKREDKFISDFFYNYLKNICGFNESMIFYTSVTGGMDQSLKTLEKQINEILTSKNTFVTFCIASEEFLKSQYCMFEGGAVWATKQNHTIGLVYNDYQKLVPEYLKSMPKLCVNFSNPTLTDELYISIVKMINAFIKYLNQNYIEESKKKPLIEEDNIPDAVQLQHLGKTSSEFYNSDVVAYWTQYVINR